ncbi:hypothetical protein EQG49_07805 [Periweissella cryptocerci]|uniref:Gram-positive pilin subunit D1 N-terminal domain-containing protein n=1 Tax=Periweissella cryptocerci TaxID=2506420 RepID=A0A4P6YUI6_9LACO|nr:pilin N-terminal domain-containing protein [Periweissella cryptocerci]QBO36373.1 hypothetical protein EQG49_07805 [Periweissella cryptocerci]
MNKIKQKKGLPKLIQGMCIAILIVPLFFTAFFGPHQKNSASAAPKETINLVVHKMIFEKGNYPVTGDDMFNNQGNEIDDIAGTGGTGKEGVPFALYQVNTNIVQNNTWQALVAFINGFEVSASDTVPPANGSRDDGVREGLQWPESVETAIDEIFANGTKTSVRTYIQRAYAAAAAKDKDGELSAAMATVTGTHYYPMTAYSFSRVVEELLKAVNNNIDTPAFPLAKDNKGADYPDMDTNGYRLTGDDGGKLTYENLLNDEARYILIEGAMDNGKQYRQSASPIVLDLPLTTTDDSGEVHVYPKNELPTQRAVFRKVDASNTGGPIVKNDEVTDGWVKMGNDNYTQEADYDSTTDVTSGASVEGHELLPIGGAKFVLFEYTGTKAGWERLESAQIQISKKGDADQASSYTVSGFSSRPVANPEGASELFEAADKTGIVRSPELPYGRYFFVEVQTPASMGEEHFSINAYPVVFEVNADNVDMGSGHDGIPQAIHATSYASHIDDDIADVDDWQFPNYKRPTLTKSLEVINDKTTAPDSDTTPGIAIGGGIEPTVADTYRYKLSATIVTPQVLYGKYAAFYDIFYRNEAQKVEGDFVYPTYTDHEEEEPTDFSSLLDITQIFDIKNYQGPRIDKINYDKDIDYTDGKVLDFFVDKSAEGVSSTEPQNILTTGIDPESVKSTLVLRDGDTVLGHFSNQRKTTDETDQGSADWKQYGPWLGRFSSYDINEEGDRVDNPEGIARIGWFDTQREETGFEQDMLGLVEFGTPTGTQLYWNIDFEHASELIEDYNKKHETNIAFAGVTNLDLEFDLMPKLNETGQSFLSQLQLQTLHNVGQFEWLLDQDDHPYSEDSFTAFLGGQTFKKVDQDGEILNTSVADNGSLSDAGHFYVGRKVANGATEYLVYDKVKRAVIGWEKKILTRAEFTDKYGDNENATMFFDTDSSGEFSIYGLTPNADQIGDVETHFDKGRKAVHYFIFEDPEGLSYSGENPIKYQPLAGSGEEFYVIPKDPEVPNDNPLGLGVTELGTATISNRKAVPFPVTGGIGILIFITLGLALTFVGYRYFKTRKNEA